MFERYTETARRAIFYALHEAREAHCKYIEVEHLLLGILRPDTPLTIRLLGSTEKLDQIREQIAKGAPPRTAEENPASADKPLSHESKRALANGTEEAKKVQQKSIDMEHLLLGLAREEDSFAAQIMLGHGLTKQRLKEEIKRPKPPQRPADAVSHIENTARDLTAAARQGRLEPLIGRGHEIERALHILSRRSKNNPALIGEAGVGKTSIVAGLAQRFADETVFPGLANRPILTIDATQLIAPRGPERKPFQLTSESNAILCVEGLFDLAGTGSGWGVTEAIRILEPHLSHGVLQSIATGTPAGLKQTLEKAEALARHFEVIHVLPPDGAEARSIVSSCKQQLERFHGVVIGEEAIDTALVASRRFLSHRQLPDRLIDLLDEAAARVKMQRETEPAEVIEVRQKVRAITREMEHAIANHEFEKARFWSEQEKGERQKLARLREQSARPVRNTVTAADILDVVAERAGARLEVVRRVIEEESPADFERFSKALASHIPFEGNEWVTAFASYLAACSEEQMEKLTQILQTMKGQS
jgi:ATP-dependent Clp protease ATP-binding subunit ClpC